jgi:hypothetical protein
VVVDADGITVVVVVAAVDVTGVEVIACVVDTQTMESSICCNKSDCGGVL